MNIAPYAFENGKHEKLWFIIIYKNPGLIGVIRHSEPQGVSITMSVRVDTGKTASGTGQPFS